MVYYASDGARAFTCEDLTVRVGVKTTDPPHPICYCLGLTVESLQEQLARTGSPTALGAIQAAIMAETCRCEVKNPSGRCCLGDMVRALKGMAGVSVPGQAAP